MKKLSLLLVIIMLFIFTGCQHNVSQKSFSQLKNKVNNLEKQIKNLKKQNNALEKDNQQINHSIQYLKKHLPTNNKTSPSSQKNLPHDVVKVTNKNEVKNALQKIVPKKFPNDPKAKKWTLTKLKPLPQVQTYYKMGINFGGKALADRSWLAEIHFPDYEPSASMSTYQLFIAKSKSKGWTAWQVY